MSLEGHLSPPMHVALAWQPAPTRPALEALLMLDARLAKVVAGANEPMLAQIRLAWWREQLGQLGSGSALSEPLLSALSSAWGVRAGELAVLVDGWEARLCDAGTFEELAERRGQALGAFAQLAGASDDTSAAAEVGRRWTRAEFARGRARERLGPLSLSPRLRGAAVLGAIATRAIERGEGLLASRGAILSAWRVGLIGR